ncbi:MAG: helix-turn-helix transcriptional regulator, partial [Candidatus Eremiobacteraeota bacterium]|nr:helix-turn-helix transcriptional regulator [Candidatus Eremiobacteraeota bacterium]
RKPAVADIPNMSLGKTISKYRREKGLKQSEMAEILGVSQSYVARWETDRIKPRRATLEQIAATLEVPVEKLLIGGKEGLASSLDIEDVELVEMLTEIPKLSAHERDALKVVLGSMLTRHRMAETLRSPR